MAIGDRPEQKSIAFLSEENHVDNISEAITFIGKKFNKSLNKLQTRWWTNVPDKMSNNNRNRDVPNKPSNIKSQSKDREEDQIRCFECEGYGHYIIECHNFLRKQKKGMTITLIDSDDEEEEEVFNNAFVGRYDTHSDTGIEDFLNEGMAETHKDEVDSGKILPYWLNSKRRSPKISSKRRRH
jgi:hypothetical protein